MPKVHIHDNKLEDGSYTNDVEFQQGDVHFMLNVDSRATAEQLASLLELRVVGSFDI